MRTLLFALAALASVAICAGIAGPLGGSSSPRRAPAACRDSRLDDVEASLSAIEARVRARHPAERGVRERIDAVERRLTPAAPAPEIAAPVPATHEELVERAKARGRIFDHLPEILAEEILAWEAAAAGAAGPEARVRAWTELERLYSMSGDYEAMNLVRLNILEATGLKDEGAWKRARLLANHPWGHGDIAVASSLYREMGKAPDLPKVVAVGFRMQAANLAVAGKEPTDALRLHREFIRDYEGDPDPRVARLVAAMRGGLTALESRYPGLEEK